MIMLVQDIRKSFIDFFSDRGHVFFPSSSVIPGQDPSLLFTSAGMTQFKDVICQSTPPGENTLVNYQRCIRMNDLKEVGKTGRHLTFFEMLGTWSFGAYWKETAIDFACDFVDHVLKLPRDRLVITVHHSDQETGQIWRKKGFKSSQLLVKGDEDNFWKLGSTGPCGPCTELHYRRQNEQGEEELLEFWNLVFMQYQQQGEKLAPLPFQSIDTGGGLERIALILQNVSSVFETNELKFFKEQLPETWSKSLKNTFVDHSRALTIALLDGGIFSNEGRGYALRKLARRALTKVILENSLKGFLDSEDFLLTVLSPSIETFYRDVYTNFMIDSSQIEKKLKSEENNFRSSLKQGLSLFLSDLDQSEKTGVFSGEKAFKLSDSHGFPIEVVQAICKQKSIQFDEKTFFELLNQQKQQSRLNAKFRHVTKITVWQHQRPFVSVENLLGDQNHRDGFYGENLAHTKLRDERFFYCFDFPCQSVYKWTHVESKIKFASTISPFYATGGGQICDQGILVNETTQIKILDVQKTQKGFFIEGELLSHSDTIATLFDKDFEAFVDCFHRDETTKHHSATHLLHSSLKEILDTSIPQAGCFVGPNYLRFDFNYDEKISFEKLLQIESSINEKIRLRWPIEEKVLSFKQAVDLGAEFLSEEKYGDQVRTVRFGNSFDLCGGTHVKNTSEVSVFLLISCESLSKGIKRIVAKVGASALNHLLHANQALREISQNLKVNPEDVANRVRKDQDKYEELEKSFSHLQGESLRQLLMTQSQNKSLKSGSLKFVSLPKNFEQFLKKTVDLLDQQHKGISLAVLEKSDQILYAIKVNQEMADQISAKEIALKLNSLFKGQGGGKNSFAQGQLALLKGQGLSTLIKHFEEVL
jgi:alanyl-tRNA synthetase